MNKVVLRGLTFSRKKAAVAVISAGQVRSTFPLGLSLPTTLRKKMEFNTFAYCKVRNK